MRREIFLENGYIFCVFLLYPLRDIFEKVAPSVCSRAIPIGNRKYFLKMPVQKCGFWTLGEGGYKKFFRKMGVQKCDF